MNKKYVAITIDYETWHPSEEGYESRWDQLGIKIDWEKDIISSTYQLLDVADELHVKLTLMVEMCEYIWLKENEPNVAEKIKKQLQNAVKRGHDVQLHIHPHWMPETGAGYVNGKWIWQCRYAKAEEYPFDLSEMILRCKKELENIIRPIIPNYEVTCFRAGTYLVQPFSRLSQALMRNGIVCDTSVYKGGKLRNRGYDFSDCKYRNQAYKANVSDPALEDIESEFIEIPIYAYKDNKRWCFDNGQYFGCQWILRLKWHCQNNENYYVMIGHSKETQDYDVMREQFELMQRIPGIEWVTLGEMKNRANAFLESHDRDFAAKEKYISQILHAHFLLIRKRVCRIQKLVMRKR